MQLEAFERGLEHLIGRPSLLRPFVCEGSPLNCTIMIVGYNPATSSSEDFWSYWQSGFGFRKAAWFESYVAERARAPLKPGRSRRHAISPTRRNIEAFISGAGQTSVIETNLFSMPSTSIANLAHSDRWSGPFEFLLRSIKPRVIVTHGADARRAMGGFTFTGKTLDAPHFSRISRAGAEDFGRRAASL